MNKAKIGYYALIVGIVLAVVGSAIGVPHLIFILGFLGVIVGLLNIEEKESMPYLVSIIALVLIGMAGLKIGVEVGEGIIEIAKNFLLFVGAAGLVVAIKQVIHLAKPGTQV